MHPLLQVGTSTSEVSGHAQTPGWHRESKSRRLMSQMDYQATYAGLK